MSKANTVSLYALSTGKLVASGLVIEKITVLAPTAKPEEAPKGTEEEGVQHE